MKPKHAQEHLRRMLPKLCGADIELGNFIVGKASGLRTSGEAARALLAEIDGLPRTQVYSGPSQRNGDVYNPQDWGRKWLMTNGSCVYIDLDHLELCLPEVINAYDHLAAWHAMLRIARRAMLAANAKLPEGQRIQVLVNNSDGQSHSYGSHLDFLITRRAWEDIFHRSLHPLLFLAAFQASSIVYTGQGKVGSENGRPYVPYQLTQRADFMETLVGDQTTHHRPIINSRDEALCGRGNTRDPMARFHVIFFDNTLCHAASLLKVGVMQIMLAMVEANRIDRNLLLEDSLMATVRWSRDPDLRTRCRMLSGAELTAIEVQLLFLEGAKRFVEEGDCAGLVPRAEEIVELWEDTLLKLRARNFVALMPRLDWILKLGALKRAMRQHPELSWHSPEIKHLDHLYSSLDPADGLYWAYERAGAVERLVSEQEINRFVQDPPGDTRAYTRAMLLRKVDAEELNQVDWDFMRFSQKDPDHYWRVYRTLELGNPLAFTRLETEQMFQQQTNLNEIIAVLQQLGDDAACSNKFSATKNYLN